MSMENFGMSQEVPDKLDSHDLTSAEKEELISQSKSFEDLYYNLRTIGSIVGSQQTFSSERLIELIEGVRKGNLDIDVITRTHNLRDTVIRLLNLEDKGDDSPPELEASVKLDIPSDNLSEDGDNNFEPNNPKPPEIFEAKEALDIPTENSDMLQEGNLEPPQDPLRSLTAEESEYLRTNQIMLESGLGDKSEVDKYFSLKEREGRMSSIINPYSLNDLNSNLLSVEKIKLGDAIFESRDLVKKIEKVISGAETPDVLPEEIRNGVMVLIAKNCMLKIRSGDKVEDYEYRIMLEAYSPRKLEYLVYTQLSPYLSSQDERHPFPKFGDENMETREEKIAGKFIWINGEDAVFKTATGFLIVPFEELILNNQKTLKEIKSENRSSQPGLKARYVNE